MKKLAGHKRQDLEEWFNDLARFSKDEGLDRDMYGKGTFLNQFEAQMAELFGTSSALFMPSGVMAQLIAARVWSEKNSCMRFSCHSTCHLIRHENNAYSELHNLDVAIYGSENKVVSLSDIESIKEKVSSIIIELPMRHLGGDLPSFEELQRISSYCKEKGIALHLDGARIFECLPYYNKSLQEIVSLFDSAFLSFYKGIGSTSGSMLFGSCEFVENSKIWLRRHGGNLFEIFPLAIAAKCNFEKRKDSFQSYYEKAKEFAEVFSSYDEIKVIPKIPKTNMMHILMPLSGALLNEKFKNYKLANISMGNWGEVAPGLSRLELSIGDASLEWTRDDLRGAIDYLLDK